jgi:6-phosphogluconolactonase (cycloisomerase 2 family)
MKALTRLSVAAISAAALLVGVAGTSSALAAGTEHAVFVQSDNLAGNQVVVYDRGSGGTLTQLGSYSTGGLGGALEGSVVDHLASQGSLSYDRQDGLLYAVNAGSSTVSVFAVLGEQLALRQVIASGGTFPVSITEHNGVVYVLNADEGGALQGFAVSGGRLVQLPGSNRSLGLNPAETPQFTHTPGQVAFSPDGSQLIVTTKANGSDIDVFHVGAFGRLAKAPAVNSEPGAVPFAVAFDQQGDLLVAEAGTNAVASFELHEDGTLTQLDVVPTGEAATCWIARAGSHFYASNAGSGTLSAFRSSAGGQLLTPLGNTPTDGGTVDATVTSSGHFLYVQAGAAGIVDEYAVGAQGALSEVGSVTVPGAAGGEGIVAG